MNSVSELQPAISQFYRAFGIPVSIYLKDECIVSYVPVALSQDSTYLHFSERTQDRSEYVSYISHYGIHFGYIQVKKTDICILVGPVSALPCTSRHLDEILEYLSLPFSKKANLNHWLTRAPLMELSRFRSVLSFLDYVINGSSEDPVDADAVQVSSPPSYPTIKYPYINHNSQHIEELITAAIEAGNYDMLISTLQSIKDAELSFGQIGPTSHQALRNIVLTANVIASRAAIRAGLDYEYALTLSDYYIQTSYSVKSEDEFTLLLGKMLIDYCSRVKQLNQPGDISPLTRSIISAVLSGLYKKPTVAGISKQLGYSESCVSHTFKADMNISLKTWIQQQKIKEADRLLDSEKLTMTEVSELLGYSSLSHFQSAYKKIKGCTPGNKSRNVM